MIVWGGFTVWFWLGLVHLVFLLHTQQQRQCFAFDPTQREEWSQGVGIFPSWRDTRIGGSS